MKRYVLALTGASGLIYGLRLLSCLLNTDSTVHVVMSEASFSVAKQELGIAPTGKISHEYLKKCNDKVSDIFFTCERVKTITSWDFSRLILHDASDFSAPIASGSFPTDGMVIAPCSSGTLGHIASGATKNLVHRAADVHLKERRRLILLLRESPLSLIHLRNMETVTLAGGIIQPATPHFYSQKIDDAKIGTVIDGVLARTLDLLQVEHRLDCRWHVTSVGATSEDSEPNPPRQR